ncbi:unnamed protein product [marine sediment metagenome]|uniref:Uncharacterized protein n=1 Tax=marine sediment metagenome TaxID=412755 RepID=X1AZ47_9ZZZZ
MTDKIEFIEASEESFVHEELENEMEKLIEKTIEDEKIELIEDKNLLYGIVLNLGRKIMHYMDDNELSFQEKTELISFILPKIVDVLVHKELIAEENVSEYKEFIEMSVPQIIFIIDMVVTKIDEIDGVRDDKLQISENCHIPCSIL